MINIKTLTIRNFMSIGNVSQAVNFTNNNLVLVLGENLDIGGNDSRNGTGKSTIVNALSYALYGTALTNIKRDNLINKTNLKNMYVTLEFEKDGVEYRIERGRKPGIFKFIKNNVEVDSSKEENDAQGENRHTQEAIEAILGVSHDMFKHIIALNTSVEPFLSLRAHEQRSLIEQLLGITTLSEKAEKLKEEIKLVKDKIRDQEFQIQAINEANKRIGENIKSLETKSSQWESKHNKVLDDLQSSVMSLMELDVEQELESHRQKKIVDALTSEYKLLNKELSLVEKDMKSYQRIKETAEKSLAESSKQQCPLCEQHLHSEAHQKVDAEFMHQLIEANHKLEALVSRRAELTDTINAVAPSIPDSPISTFYRSEADAYNHKSSLDKLAHQLQTELGSVNPYIDQISGLKEDGLQVIDFTVINELSHTRDHMEFLIKLLTSKDSFIRKKIIDQNISYLNHRLDYYLQRINLPHSVKFKSDLEVEIEMYGKEFDFDNLSRGEKTRLILSLSWAFRDVYENLYNKINLMFLDEIVDQGIDTSGAEGALAILKKMSRESNRNVYLISHKEEFVSRVSDVLKVTKSGGFTTFEESSTNE